MRGREAGRSDRFAREGQRGQQGKRRRVGVWVCGVGPGGGRARGRGWRHCAYKHVCLCPLGAECALQFRFMSLINRECDPSCCGNPDYPPTHCWPPLQRSSATAHPPHTHTHPPHPYIQLGAARLLRLPHPGPRLHRAHPFPIHCVAAGRGVEGECVLRGSGPGGATLTVPVSAPVYHPPSHRHTSCSLRAPVGQL